MKRKESREEQWQRLNALAGRDEYGNIAPPKPDGGIDRTGLSWWKNAALDEGEQLLVTKG